MPRSAELYEKAAAEVAAAQKIEADANAQKRDLMPEEQEMILSKCASAEAARKQGDAYRKLETTAQAVSAPIPYGDLSGPPTNHAGPVAAEPIDRDRILRHEWRSLGEFAMAAVRHEVDKVTDPRLGLTVNAAGTGLEQATPSKGGFLVPPSFSTQIWDGVTESPDNLLSLCDQYTVEGESLTFPAAAETSRATGSRPVRGYWMAEAAQMTASNPTFRQVKIEPQELGVLCYVTNKLLRNANALEAYLRKSAVDEINFCVGDAIINGTGAAQPLGILNSDCIVSVAKDTSQAADTILANNLIKMRARILPRFWAGAVWLANQDILPQLAQLFYPVKNVAGAENVGGYNAAMFNMESQTLMGKRVIFTEWSATLGDTGDIILAGMQGYVVGTRGGIEAASSIHLRFDYNETAFKFIFEVDGKPWLLSAITPYKGTSNTLSTFVKLDART